jgi:hypothetical protein
MFFPSAYVTTGKVSEQLDKVGDSEGKKRELVDGRDDADTFFGRYISMACIAEAKTYKSATKPPPPCHYPIVKPQGKPHHLTT